MGNLDSYSNEGSRPLPQTPFPIQGRGLKNLSQKPTKNFRFWYRGTRDDFLLEIHCGFVPGGFEGEGDC